MQRPAVTDLADRSPCGREVGSAPGQDGGSGPDGTASGGSVWVGAEVVVEAPATNELTDRDHLRRPLVIDDLTQHAVERPKPIMNHLHRSRVGAAHPYDGPMPVDEERGSTQERAGPYGLGLDLRV